MKAIRITALWCMSCLLMKKRWKHVFSDYPEIEVIDYDYDEDHGKIKSYDIKTILPVVLFINEGKEIKRLTGEMSEEKIKQAIEEIYEETDV